MRHLLTYLALCIMCVACARAQQPSEPAGITPAAERTGEYLHLLEGRKVGLVVNHTAKVGSRHLVDTLVSLGIDVRTIFAPEHGFRGTADAGQEFGSYKDPDTGIEVYSIYGKTKKPPVPEIAKLDVVLFDIQDVGLRFYTYLSSMHYVMESCAEAGVPFIVLDRPNPNGMYIDGPILDPKYKSFVGMHPIPVVHGMTLGELARMINGEGWLEDGMKCDLTVIECAGYKRSDLYELPVRPSPNLPNMRSIYLYPSLCLFEGTPVSIGRGTDFPFQVYGHPAMEGDFTFTPRASEGAKNPPQKDKLCTGCDLREEPDNNTVISDGIDLSYVIDGYNQLRMGDKYFTRMFELLIGVDWVREGIIAGKSPEQIKASWAPDVEKFKIQRKPYLLYED